jgi:hypothetical protein
LLSVSIDTYMGQDLDRTVVDSRAVVQRSNAC